MTQELWNQLGITGWQVLALVVATTVLFWAFTLVMGYFGQQMRARVTITTFAIMTLVGAVTARAMLGTSPTMMGGVVVLVMLFAWEGVFRLLGHRLPIRLIPVRQARVVLRDGVIDDQALKQAHLRPTDLMVRLRRAGVTMLADAAYVIVERDGSITVIRAGQGVDPRLLVDVAGIEHERNSHG